ncbi:DUF975 family protein [Nicoliella lavandulae]|uniref:DUF975 family protein n=1 Tax=Nicoliella lavandulae TaxID=3082954 RepID=A0ABU8SKW0_9LACO
MQIRNLKTAANQEFMKHFRFYFILFLPYLILVTLSNMIARSVSDALFVAVNNGDSVMDAYATLARGPVYLTQLIGILGGLVLIGLSFNILDLIRHRSDYQNPIGKSTALFGNRMVLGVLAIVLLQFLFTFLWTLLFIVPGIIKNYSYSQAVYIYRDAIKNGHPISPLAAITASRKLMVGHKGELFILQLSFIGWFFLLYLSTNLLVFPILGIFIYPYFQITLMNYYRQLTNS